MKYPQLVSTRAVSAISDWLVTQLEQLGVDASSVYSRLLLSLLHTPLQINALDLAEISDNKVGNFARNKLLISKSGNGVNCRRFSAADTEALKRLAAIDSLLEAVPSDQQLSKIETLVDELSLKLREIEEQNGLDDSVFEIEQTDDNALCNSKVTTIEKKTKASEDPANRYFSAFPALSEQSKAAYSHKPSSWPQVNNNHKDSLSQKSENPCSSSGGAIAIVKKKSKRRRVTNSTMTPTLTNHLDPNSAHPSTQSKNTVATSAKNSRALTSRSNQKKKTLEMWDTNFDGAWEMGRDLIREFVMKQQNNRNRSISESDAVRFASLESESSVEKAAGTVNDHVDLVDFGTSSVKRCDYTDNDEENLMRVAAAATSALFGKNFEMNIYALSVPDTETGSSSSRFTDSSLFMSNNDKTVVRSEGYATPDTLASWSETDASDQRDRMNREFMNSSDNVKNCDERGDCVDSGCDENLAAFEAKFNRNVEALWNDRKPHETRPDPKKEPQLNHSFWFTYYSNNAEQSNQQPKISSEQFKQFFQNTQTSYLSGGDKNPFISAQPNSLNSTSSSTTGGMNLTTSIWTDNPNNNENDISFYANARLWEMNEMNNSKSLSRKMNPYSMEPAVNFHDKTNALMATTAHVDIGNCENSSFSKWSDTETPFAANQQDTCMSPQKIKEEKIRKNLFENSYFCNYQSSQPTSSSTNVQNATHIDNMNSEFPVSQTQKVVKRKVTLVNHSSRSCFKEVEPLSFEARQELFCKNNARKYPAVSMDPTENEDLLTSERSRFRPIKHAYADGHTFDISNKLDQISYERSQSGLLYHDSEVYREYYVYDEEGNGGSHCDTEVNTPAEFTLKYCIRQNDKSCQTDDSLSSQPNISLSKNENLNRMPSFNSLSNANIASLQNNNRLYFQRNDMNRAQYEEKCVTNDILEKLIEISQDSWCSEENRRCCNNNNSIHALWEHCATCSNDMISVPANSLLKDDILADGDEIMSDLKYLIQSISFRSDWEDSDSMPEYNDVDQNVLIQALKPKITDASRNLLTEYDEGFDDGNNDDFSSNHIYSNVNKLISDLLQPEKAQTLVQAISEKCHGRLPTDDKCSTTQDPITKKRIIHETKDIQATKNEISCNSSPLLSVNANSSNFFGSLWAHNNDNSIWGRETSTNRFGEQWEHANLEKLWKCTPSSNNSNQSVSMATDEQQQMETDKTIFSTTSNDEWSISNGNSLAPDVHTKPETNTLQKFMDLIKQQSNESGRYANIGSNARNQNEHLHKHITRYDRKRRHSATSQNCFDHLNYALTNCDAIESIKKLATKTVSDYDGTNHFNRVPNENETATIITCKYWTACDSFCLTSTLAFNNNNNTNNNNNNNNVVGDTELFTNCYHKHLSKCHPKFMDPLDGNESLTMHPTTFLAKQMAAMVSRPLTR